MSDILVAYYSRAGENYFGGSKRYIKVGNTKRAAESIAASVGADIFEIRQKVPYSDVYDECIAQAKDDLRKKARPEIEGFPEKTGYRTMVLAYPNYWGTVPMAVLTFLEGFSTDGMRILPLCTNEGSGMGRSESDIKAACPDAEIGEGLEVPGSSVGTAGAEKRISDWLKAAGL
ncbi:hypothetical protein AUQ37_08275 [Candidatus Methanomethylophilus sp. 1R26]|uniref:flavodoxin n=1 Tax=Candidatus Methanomethylophilus sp. 1R26 TaxID=1769296 RepID=UPI000736881D|nr:flavodoxin [Candidatus Methanomethylophilus sp. 1R26]KUE73684.1 hypothetical protein AUQ37_08275 [Candidatus Methanomethylophilus sp. 1R26]